MIPDSSPETTEADPETIRLAHLRRESGVKSVGWLCYLVAFFSLLGTLEFFLFTKGILAQPPEMKAVAGPELVRLALWLLTLGFLINTIAQLALGYGLTHLQAWARWTVVVLTVLSLASHSLMSLIACATHPTWGVISLAVGGAIHGLILYPLVAAGSDMIFSPAYRKVIEQTPTIRARMHWLLKLFIGLILAGCLGFLLLLLAIYRGIIDV